MDMIIKFLTVAFTVALLFSSASAQSLSGIKVGDSPSALEKINLEPLFREGQGAIKIVKYRLANGNELSVTYNSRENRIIYIENDWSLKPEGAATDLPAFKFGITTLEEIRKVNGSNGFSWKSTAVSRAGDQLVTFNAYEIKGKPNVIAVFVTSLNIPKVQKKMSDPNQIAKFIKLQAIILAEEDYLDELWGEEKIYDKDSKPISWDTISGIAQSPDGLTLSQQTREILEKWVDLSSNSIGQYSVRAATDPKDSLFKDKDGNYKWFMRIDYKKPKNKVAFSISNGYFNCDESEVSFDQTVNYSSDGLVIETLGEKGGRKKAIPITPDSVAEKSLKFVCSVKFD